MSKINEALARLNGLTKSDFEPRNAEQEIDDALVELAEMLANQEEAICELAEMIGGNDNG